MEGKGDKLSDGKCCLLQKALWVPLVSKLSALQCYIHGEKRGHLRDGESSEGEIKESKPITKERGWEERREDVKGGRR